MAAGAWLGSVEPARAFQRETTDDPDCVEDVGVNCPHLGVPFFWPTSEFPVPYVVNSDFSGVSFGAVRGAVDRAFATWQNASSGGITFAFAGQSHGGSDGQDGQNTISWQDLSSSSDTFGQSIITFESSTGEIVDVDVELNGNFPFAVLPPEDNPFDPRVDIQAVVTHEVGHFLGLAHENRMGPQVVMFFSDTSGNTSHRTLTADDRNGVRSIYVEGGSGGGGGG
ncbi:MAG: matrixin family metalloprotease, partial [Candidatus Binatia bacterium]